MHVPATEGTSPCSRGSEEEAPLSPRSSSAAVPLHSTGDAWSPSHEPFSEVTSSRLPASPKHVSSSSHLVPVASVALLPVSIRNDPAVVAHKNVPLLWGVGTCQEAAALHKPPPRSPFPSSSRPYFLRLFPTRSQGRVREPAQD